MFLDIKRNKFYSMPHIPALWYFDTSVTYHRCQTGLFASHASAFSVRHASIRICYVLVFFYPLCVHMRPFAYDASACNAMRMRIRMSCERIRIACERLRRGCAHFRGNGQEIVSKSKDRRLNIQLFLHVSIRDLLSTCDEPNIEGDQMKSFHEELVYFTVA